MRNPGRRMPCALRTAKQSRAPARRVFAVAKAMMLRKVAGELCRSGRNDDGVKKLEEALKDIGVKPAS